MVHKFEKYPESLNFKTFFNDRNMYNTTQLNTLLSMLHRGYRIGEVSLHINPSNSCMHHKA